MNPPSSMHIPSIDTMVLTFVLHVNLNPSQGGNKIWNPNSIGKPPFSKPNRACTHSGRTNHTIDTCFVKHIYPLGFKNYAKNCFFRQQCFWSGTYDFNKSKFLFYMREIQQHHGVSLTVKTSIFSYDQLSYHHTPSDDHKLLPAHW